MEVLRPTFINQPSSVFPPQPPLRPIQRFMGRFWDTKEMLDILSTFYGTRHSYYPRSWMWRALIAVHRDQYAVGTFARKGYGPDWNGGKDDIRKGGIKASLIDYTSRGKLPMIALKMGAEHIRAMELALWAERRKKEREEIERS